MSDGCNHFSFSGASGHFEMAAALPGPPGPQGKSAYEAAVEGGYTGTEAEFNAALAEVDTALQPSDVDAELSDSTNPVQNKVVKAALDGKAPVIYDTASGAVASIPDGADGMPIKSLVVNIEPVQDTSGGDPSPTHICPISGWTGCNIPHSGADTSDPDIITATWQDEAGTVYYGIIDIISGVLSALAAMFDMGDLTYTETTSGIRFDISGGVGSGVQGAPAAFAMCSAYKLYADTIQTISQITLPNNCIVQTTASGARARYYIRDDRYTTAAAMKAGVSGVQFLCELREPITYQLTPQQVNTLPGINNFWANCGPVSVEFRADTKLYIDKKLAALVAALS